MHPFITFLKKRLRDSLPGRQAQLKMAPKPVDGGPGRELEPSDTATKSSVLILLFPNDEEELELLLTLRHSDIDHGGQISFPGGRAEQGEDFIKTALREAKEEVGVSPADIEILGRTTELFIKHSDNYVTPVVGYMNYQPKLDLDPTEVEEAFSIELDSLLTKKNLATEQWKMRAYTYRVPYWDVHRVPLWGATAMMLNEFMELYREYRAQQPKEGSDLSHPDE